MTDTYDHFPEFTPRFDPLGVHPHEIPTEGIFDSPGVNVFINARWASHITGMIERLIYLDAWQGSEAERYAAIDKIVKIVSEFDKSENQGDRWLAQQYARTQIHFHQYSKVVSGNVIEGVANAAQEFGWSWRQNTSAINNEFYFEMLLPADTLDFDLCHFKQAGGGILTLKLDAETPFLTVDLYAAATNPNVHTTGFFTISQPGLHKITGKVASKNASSSGYVANLTYFSVRPHYGTG